MMFKKALLATLVLCSFFIGQAHARPKNAAYFIYGDTYPILQERVGPAGGVFFLQSSEGWIDGAKIKVPAGALKKEVSLTVSYNDGALNKVKTGWALEGALLIEFDGITKLDNFVTFKLPYMQIEDGQVCIGFIPDEKGTIEAMTSIAKDEIISFRPKTAITLVCS